MESVSGDKKDKGSTGPVRLRPRAPCPICAKPSVRRYHPFCSLTCADIDLGRWLSGRYVVAAAEPSEDDDGTSEPSAEARANP